MANIRLEQMTPTQKVAALLITLGPSAASEIMKNIEDDNALEQITIEIAGLAKLPQEVIEAVVDEFYTVFQASSMLASGGMAYAKELFELRKAKGVTEEDAAKLVQDVMYYGIMMVKTGDADGLVSGAVHTTGDMLRPALQLIKTKPGIKVVSSSFLMDCPNKNLGHNGLLVYADCVVMPNPTADELAEIGISAADTAKRLCGIEEPKVAFLSFSTKGSAKHELVTKVQQAVAKAHELAPDLCLDGEMQFDAALVPEIGASKAPGSPVAGHANVLIFPDLQAGNIGYKITQRIGGAECFAVLQGLAKPCNDLSRGCSVEDIVNTVAFTAVQAQ